MRGDVRQVLALQRTVCSFQKGLAEARRVVLASSAAVYGRNPAVPLSEDATLAPRSPYALHKRIGEQYAQLYSELYGLETVALRYFNVNHPCGSATGITGQTAGQTADFSCSSLLPPRTLVLAHNRMVMRLTPLTVHSRKDG
jgi:UDP-glucose 4-epimerase